MDRSKIVDALADDDFINAITIDHPEELPLHPRDMVRVRLPDSEVPKGMLERLQVLSFNEATAAISLGTMIERSLSLCLMAILSASCSSQAKILNGRCG